MSAEIYMFDVRNCDTRFLHDIMKVYNSDEREQEISSPEMKNICNRLYNLLGWVHDYLNKTYIDRRYGSRLVVGGNIVKTMSSAYMCMKALNKRIYGNMIQEFKDIHLFPEDFKQFILSDFDRGNFIVLEGYNLVFYPMLTAKHHVSGVTGQFQFSNNTNFYVPQYGYFRGMVQDYAIPVFWQPPNLTDTAKVCTDNAKQNELIDQVALESYYWKKKNNLLEEEK